MPAEAGRLAEAVGLGMSDFRRELRDPDLIAFYEYWLSLCAGRRMPRREDIDPLSIPSGYLADLMLVEVLEGPLRYRYRLIGTHVVEASGEDRTGRYFDDVSFFKLNPVVTRQYDAVVANGRPLYSLEPFTNLRPAPPTRSTACCCRCRATASASTWSWCCSSSRPGLMPAAWRRPI